jgi:hypothetical protein
MYHHHHHHHHYHLEVTAYLILHIQSLTLIDVAIKLIYSFFLFSIWMPYQIFQTYQMLFLKQVEMWNIRELLYTAVMKCKVQRFVSMYCIVCHIYASPGGGSSSINEPKMHRREWQVLYYTDGLIHMCTDICCDALTQSVYKVLGQIVQSENYACHRVVTNRNT